MYLVLILMNSSIGMYTYKTTSNYRLGIVYELSDLNFQRSTYSITHKLTGKKFRRDFSFYP